VIAVDLNSDLIGRHTGKETNASNVSAKSESSLLVKLQSGIASLLSSDPEDSEQAQMPSMLDVLAASINIMQVRVTRGRLAGEPADLIIAPRLARLALMDFHRAAEAIEEGRKAAEDLLPDLKELV
jgi:NTE family protein